MDGPRDHHQSGVSQKEMQILYIDAYMWNMKINWGRQSYLQSRNRDTDVENTGVDTKGEREVWWIGRLGLTCIYY